MSSGRPPQKGLRNVLADIASGEVDWADVCFLIAAILFFLAALVAIPRPNTGGAPWYSTLIGLGLTLTAVALLLL